MDVFLCSFLVLTALVAWVLQVHVRQAVAGGQSGAERHPTALPRDFHCVFELLFFFDCVLFYFLLQTFGQLCSVVPVYMSLLLENIVYIFDRFLTSQTQQLLLELLQGDCQFPPR